MKSIMTKDFSRIAQTDIQRSTFDRSHGLKTAFDSGYLVPVELQEVVPSDEVKFDARFLARLAPVVTPVMDSCSLDLHAFFIPSRLLWKNFTKMMGERKNPNDSIDYLTPKIKINTANGECGIGSLADFLGIPVQQLSATGGDLLLNSLPFRAYQKVWDDWYRDENLQDSIIGTTDELGDAVIDGENESDKKWYKLRKRGKRHDYFTSGLPWPQKGEGVNLPLGGTAPVVPIDDSGNVQPQFRIVAGGNGQVDVGFNRTAGVGSLYAAGINGNNGLAWSDPKLQADLSDATAATINSLRMAFQLQRMLESDARGGTRYVEIIRNHFKTICPDARLQRSEFLGSTSIPITFSPIAQTSGTTDTSPQGNLAATAHAFGNLKFHRSFSEHGFLIVLASVRCDLNYQQGVNRLWLRNGRYDYYWPTLAHLGEQEIRNCEIYAQGKEVFDENGNPVDDMPFAYQERYAELRYNPSMITGKMRSGITGSLDVWHLAQDFDSLPKLSAEFIEENPPLDRVLAVTEGEPQILLEAYLGQKWTRPLPTYSIPGLIDHL